MEETERMRTGTLIALLLAATCWSCADVDNQVGSTNADSDTDTDTDSDTDADTDADTDGDSDGDAGPDTDTGDCVPDCEGKECGDDGCGGYCGACVTPPNDSCLDGGVVDHFEEEQIGICDVFACVYESEAFPCPAGSTCGQDAWDLWACTGQTPQGNLEAASSTSIAGWACDPDTPWSSIDLHLYFDSIPGDASPTVRIITASNPSEQPVSNACGGGDNHRFDYAPDSTLLTELGSGAHTVYAFGINSDGLGNNPQISNSPATFTVP